jgi:RHS repeat-associated protein
VDIFPGDFNADGLSDLLAATKNYTGNGIKYHTDFKLYKKTSASGTTFTPTSTYALENNFEVVGNFEIPSNYSFMITDFNGTGRDDVLTTRKSPVGGYKKLDLVRTYYPDATASSLSSTDFPFTGTFQIVHPNGNYIHLGDFNGDGRGDYLTMVSNASYYKAYISFDNSSARKEVLGISGTEWVQSDWMGVVDYDGDGKSEIMVVDESITKIYTFKNFGSTYITAEKIYEAGYPTKWHKIYLGDFNGDRKTDLMTRGTTTNSWETAISKGKGNGFQTSAFTFNTTVDLNGDYMLISDFDGDAKTDIVHWYNNTSTTSKLEMYYSRGNSFNPVTVYNYSTIHPVVGNTYRNVTLADHNGDGKTDMIARYYYQDPVKMLLFYKDSKNNMLEKVANGFNHLTHFQYKSLAEGGTFYTKGTSSSYPLTDIQPPLYAVSSITESNGVGTTNLTNFTYEKAKTHRKGRGFLGFEKTTLSAVDLNHKKVSEFQVNTNFYVNRPYKVTESVLTTSAVKTVLEYDNGFVNLTNGRYWLRPNAVKSGTFSSTPTKTTTFTYDSYGNVTTESVTVKDFNNASTIETSLTTNTYGTFCTWIPAKPTQTTVSMTRTGQPAFSKTITRTYSTTNGSMTSEKDFDGLYKAVLKNYLYDAFGNVTSVSTYANGVAPRTTTFSYDPKGRFVTTTNHPMGHTTTATYSAKWGKPTSQTAINGNTTTFAYDAFGRMTSTTTPEGNTVSYNYVWHITNNSIGNTSTRVYKVTTTAPGRPSVNEYFDVLGRSVKTETEGFGSGQWVVREKTFNEKGQLATSTAPYYSGGSGVVTTFAYDFYGRQTSAANSAGTTGTAYTLVSGQYKTTVTAPDGTTSSQTIDNAGKTVSATDNGGTLTYTYNSFGNQISVKMGTTTLVSMGYDEYGRQTSLNDVGAGLTTYDYNALGELVSQTDANGNTHTMSYDYLNRITSRTGPEGTTTYEYETTNNGKGLVKKVTGFNGYLQEYTYDQYNRMTQGKETVDATPYSTDYTYNAYGDVASVTWPSGYKINKAYNTKGYLTTIKNANNTITLFNAGGKNAYGQYTSYTLGNNVTTTKTYDAFGFPTNFTAGSKQNLSMSFNVQNGNLNSRTDNLISKVETFTYDNLHRLTGSTVSGQTAKTVAYASNGNINTKTDVGSYTYLGSKIHAVKEITNPNGTVPTGTQDVAFTPYHQPATITEGIHEATLNYGPDYERRKMVVKQNGSTTETRYYFGAYEKQVAGSTTTHLHYITCDAGLVAIVRKVGTTDNYHYVYTDHLGSITRVTNPSGTDWEQNFDAWGRERNPATWTYTSVPTPPSWLYRGYTGHEYLPQFRLVNMNGRVYDPVLGRMLSVDNYAHEGTQGMNRYAYAHNNPLKYVDIDGENPALVFFAFAAAILATSSQAAQGNIGGPLDFFGTFAFNMGVAYLAGAVGSGISSALAPGGSFGAGFTFTTTATSTGFVSGAAAGFGAGAFGGFVGGFGNSLLNGSGVNSALETGKKAGINGAIGGLISGGIGGGIDAARRGRNFWTGNIKLHDADPGYVASLGNEIFVGDYEDVGYTVANLSDYDAYYKPEDGVYGLSNKIPSGKMIFDPVDGIATSKYSDMVYKIPGKLQFRPSATIRHDGDILLSFGPLDRAALWAKQLSTPDYIYGWIGRSQIDDSWGTLFDLAKVIR